MYNDMIVLFPFESPKMVILFYIKIYSHAHIIFDKVYKHYYGSLIYVPKQQTMTSL